VRHLLQLRSKDRTLSPFLVGLLRTIMGALWITTAIVMAGESRSRPSFTQLLARLQSPQRAVRVLAQEELLTHGEEFLPEIEETLVRAAPDLKPVLERIQQRIVIHRAERMLDGSPITFQGASLEQAVKALMEQSSTRIELSSTLRKRPDSTHRLMNWNQVPFWEALSLLCQAEGLRWHWADHRTIQLNDPPLAGAPEPCFSGSVIVRGEPIAPSAKAISPGSGSATRLRFQLDVEAGVQPYFLSIHDADFHLLHNGKIMGLLTPEAAREIDFSDQTVQFTINFLASEDLSTASLFVRGNVRMHCAVFPQELHFPLVSMENRIRWAGRNLVKFVSAKQETGSLRVFMQVQFAPDVSWESHRQGHLHRAAWLQRASGERIPFRSFEVIRAEGGTHDIIYEFPSADHLETDLAMVYSMPAIYRVMPVPIELQWRSTK